MWRTLKGDRRLSEFDVAHASAEKPVALGFLGIGFGHVVAARAEDGHHRIDGRDARSSQRCSRLPQAMRRSMQLAGLDALLLRLVAELVRGERLSAIGHEERGGYGWAGLDELLELSQQLTSPHRFGPA